MALTRAAVVTSFDEPPRYQEFDLPKPGENQALVDVLAVGLHPRVRSGAAGKHYTSTDQLPLIPGVDGVGRMSDGTRVYFATDDALPGPMAEKAVVDTRRMVYLRQDADAIKVAAAMNPAMSSWVALRRRVPIERGQSVLVFGATGNAGTMAVRVAKRLGAGRVIGAGRDTQRLNGLIDVGADEIVQLTEIPARQREHWAGPRPKSTLSSIISGATLPRMQSWPCCAPDRIAAGS
jgi:NADPH:quinone reductase-like Zn-dependent oxidoreductase